MRKWSLEGFSNVSKHTAVKWQSIDSGPGLSHFRAHALCHCTLLLCCAHFSQPLFMLLVAFEICEGVGSAPPAALWPGCFLSGEGLLCPSLVFQLKGYLFRDASLFIWKGPPIQPLSKIYWFVFLWYHLIPFVCFLFHLLPLLTGMWTPRRQGLIFFFNVCIWTVAGMLVEALYEIQLRVWKLPIHVLLIFLYSLK